MVYGLLSSAAWNERTKSPLIRMLQASKGKDETNARVTAFDRFDRVVVGGAAILAIQQELGLLPQQHGGGRANDHYHSAALRPNLRNQARSILAPL